MCRGVAPSQFEGSGASEFAKAFRLFWQDGRWAFRIEPLPYPRGIKESTLAMFGDAGWGSSGYYLLKKLGRKKASRYQTRETPYVVFVSATRHPLDEPNEWEITNALLASLRNTAIPTGSASQAPPSPLARSERSSTRPCPLSHSASLGEGRR